MMHLGDDLPVELCIVRMNFDKIKHFKIVEFRPGLTGSWRTCQGDSQPVDVLYRGPDQCRQPVGKILRHGFSDCASCS